MVVALQYAVAAGRAADGADVGDVVILGMHRDVAALTGADRVAVGPGDTVVLGGAGHRQAGVVLLGGVDVVGKAIVSGDAVELGGRLVEDSRPGGAAVVAHAGPPVVALDHALRICGIDPQIVIVAVRGGHLVVGAASIGRAVHL